MPVYKDRTALDCVISHVFLPPMLPGGEENVSFTHELSNLLIVALEEFYDHLSKDNDAHEAEVSSLLQAKEAIETFASITMRNDDFVSADLLEKQLSKSRLQEGTIPVYVKAQNAGVLIRIDAGSFSLETFELSPVNSAVMENPGRLRRQFPETVNSVNYEMTRKEEFQEAISTMISTLSQQSVNEMESHAKKAGQDQVEKRNTTDPSLVKQLLTSIVGHTGVPLSAHTVWKNTRDEVRWFDGNKLCWRRSPVWLLLRVTLQLILSRQSQDDRLYKRFMVFFMSKVLQNSIECNSENEFIYVMQAKIAQRLRKLDGSISGQETWAVTIRESLSKAVEYLDQHWDNVTKTVSKEVTMPTFNHLDVANDLEIPLPKLDAFISSIDDRSELQASSSFCPSSEILLLSDDALPVLDRCHASSKYVSADLATFEQWVAENLNEWIERHINDPTTCRELERLMRKYHGVAEEVYSSCPNGTSMMILTLLELWIACDKSATAIAPLLMDYPCHVPCQPWGSLLLKFSCDMMRLDRAEKYLKMRQKEVKRRLSIFGVFGTAGSFPICYFDSSPQLQNLKKEIERIASDERAQKTAEFHERKLEYDRLKAKQAATECVNYEDENGDLRHSFSCSSKGKCRFTNAMAEMSIDIHEWPLPSNDLKAKATVFELDIPESFAHWRDATIYLLKDVLGSQTSSAPPSKYTLDSVNVFQRFAGASAKGRRVTLLSETKPNSVTHRAGVKIAHTTLEDVHLNNGLNWEYYDSSREAFVDSDPWIIDEIWEVCTFKLPHRSKTLQSYLNRPSSRPDGQDPNAVIARQDECPYHLSLHEFKALCDLPLGSHVQWLNLLRQLSMPTVNWKIDETALFAWQISEQCGPAASSWERKSHSILQNFVFAQTLVDNLSTALSRVKENWESYKALGIFTALATRLLSVGHEGVKSMCLEYLAECRRTSAGWSDILHEKRAVSLDDEERKSLYASELENALVCIASFDVDDHDLQSLLAEPDNLFVFLKSSFAIQETLMTGRRNESLQNSLLLRWRRLLLRSMQILNKQVLYDNNPGLDRAVKSRWQAFRRLSDEQWTLQANCWLTTKAASANGKSFLQVHVNLLTAELLVNGLPLSRLPRPYESHPTYLTLFGRYSMDAVPSPEPGMAFSLKSSLEGQVVHLNLSSTNSQENDILVRTWKGICAYDLVPSRLFQRLLPKRFVEQYLHWYNFNSGILELRPLKTPWSSDSSQWRMERMGRAWLVRDNEGRCLINPDGQTSRSLFEVFKALENLESLHFIYANDSKMLMIEIPRLKLQFEMCPGSSNIFSTQFKGMCVDKNQGIGTLVGLKNKLVLRTVDGLSSRLILIPDARPKWEQVQYSENSRHVAVSIDYSAEGYQAYHLNQYLGCLVGNGSLQSKLFLAQLHALTSSCVPDPFTGHTGAEESISILSSAGVRSFDYLSSENVQTLEAIAGLAPRRVWYPKGLREMQVVRWDKNLSFLAQHEHFPIVVKAILDQADETAFLFENSHKFKPLQYNDSLLEMRERIRASTIWGHGFGAEDFTKNHDVEYSPRGQTQDCPRALRSRAAAHFVANDYAALPYKPSGSFVNTIHNLLASSDGTVGPTTAISIDELQYDSKWLESPKKLMKSLWCRIHYTMGGNSVFNKFRLMCWLGTMAFAQDCNESALLAMMAFVKIPEAAKILIPSLSKFYLLDGKSSNFSTVHACVFEARHPFETTPESRFPNLKNETQKTANGRRRRNWERKYTPIVGAIASDVDSQWPCTEPSIWLQQGFQTYIDVPKATRLVQAKFIRWTENAGFHKYLEGVYTCLQRQTWKSMDLPMRIHPSNAYVEKEARRNVVLDDILCVKQASDLSCDDAEKNFDPKAILEPITEEFNNRLSGLLEKIESQVSSREEHEYMSRLRESASCLHNHRQKYQLKHSTTDLREILEKHMNIAGNNFKTIHDKLVSELGRHQQMVWPLISISYQWPRVCARKILLQLNRGRWSQLSESWKRAFVVYACSLSFFQGAERLLQQSSQHPSLIKELRSQGPRTWSCFKYPESLLLEIESNLRIREVQEEIAKTMRHPPGEENAVMQLNMGEGKSSVIVPIVSASLANGSQLVRVIVAKPQSRQMFEMLVAKLGGLIGRRIYHLPFARATPLGLKEAETIHSLCNQCMSEGGVLLVQPENLLSFQLMAIERCIDNDADVAKCLLGTQGFFDNHSRDVVDESDENFSVKFELIYTIGKQCPIEHAPERWSIIQNILSLVFGFAVKEHETMATSVEVESLGNGRVPMVRFLDEAATKEVLDQVSTRLCENGANGFPIAHQSQEARKLLRRYITETQPPQEVIRAVEEGCFWTDATCNNLLLMRGLFAGGLLAFVFGQKRWRVNYGPDHHRQPGTKLAVPYRAKDSPSLRSEFSHPDVVIILTTLSYYYGGLSDEELFLALGHLFKSDQASVEYALWVASAPGLNSSFKQIEGVNLRDENRCKSLIFPHLRFSKHAIDYFLSHIVFSKEMREFPHRLSASGWDIGKSKTNPTTGFSGTNDSRRYLPLTVKQLDLSSQMHTNALVMDHLLRPENSVEVLTTLGYKGVFKSCQMLELVASMDPETRVILDVGAQIINMTNEEVARTWLELVKDRQNTQAVVFCSDKDEIMVLDRRGRIESLQTSPFAKQLGLCLVYLDEAHTRGIDLRLPHDYRAAVSLGANLTKDRLVQACMRMRQLGEGQTVVFLVTEEIETKIMALVKDTVPANISISDILQWSISETWADIRRSMPLWATQGTTFAHQQDLWAKSKTGDSGLVMAKSLASQFLDDEAQTLAQRYKPRKASDTIQANEQDHPLIREIHEVCQGFEGLDMSGRTLQEEQERELAPEVEQERQDERPAAEKPAKHELDDAVLDFIKTGVLDQKSPVFAWAWEALDQTSASANIDVRKFPHGLRVTRDFIDTIVTKNGQADDKSLDLYQKSAQWVLVNNQPGQQDKIQMLIISPFEADRLMEDIERSKAVTLRVYAPRQNKGLTAIDHVALYVVPSNVQTRPIPERLTLELNLFSGQTYFSSFQEYTRVCDYLGLAWRPAEVGMIVRPDGFIECEVDCEDESCGRFHQSPVQFLKMVMTRIRGNCESIEKTHVGKMLEGTLLTEEDFEGGLPTMELCYGVRT